MRMGTGLNYNYARDYDPGTGRYVESDPLGFKGGINTYAYGRDNPLSYIDPNGLFSLSVEASWSVVDEIPGNQWWGWIPGIGGNRIGLTQGWLAPAKCHCKSCGGSWTLSECSAFLDIRVSIEAGLNAGANMFSTRAEGEHVADLKAGVERIRQAGAAAERDQQKRTFSSESDCEQQSSDAVTAAIRAMRQVISIESGGVIGTVPIHIQGRGHSDGYQSRE